MKTSWPLLLLAFSALLWPLQGAQAQASEALVTLAPPLTEAFPKIQVFATVQNPQGQPYHGLRQPDFTLLEDDQPVALLEVKERHPGVQVVFALNPGPPLGVRDELGVTRYEYIRLQWLSWAQQPVRSEIYDLSVTTGTGVLLRHSAQRKALAQTLTAYQPDFRASEPSLAPLDTALQLASDPTPRPGMGRALIFLTPLLPQESLQTLPQYVLQAKQAGVRIFVWLVAPPEQWDSPAAHAWEVLTQGTGGTLTFFSGTETLPLLEDLLAPLEYAYQLTYLSRIREGEHHTLTLQIHTPQGDLSAPPVGFSLQVLPPNPALVDPPVQIVRRPDPRAREMTRRIPETYPLTVTVGFPDGHPRPLQAVRLLVDGWVVAQRDLPPWDHLEWDLTPYTRSGTYALSVEVEDSLGLVGRGADLRVHILVPQPTNAVAQAAQDYGALLTWGVLALAALVLLWVLVKPLRREPALSEALRPSSWRDLPRWAQHLTRRAEKPTPRAWAHLIPLPQSDPEEPTAPVLTLFAAEALIGSDPAQATLVLREPSVAPVHARWWRDEAGHIFLADRGSEAGTWVNYAPVSPYGTRLEEGDIVHIGRVGFRLHLPGQEEPQVVVLPLEEGE